MLLCSLYVISLSITEQVRGTKDLPLPVYWTTNTGAGSILFDIVHIMWAIVGNWYNCKIQYQTLCIASIQMASKGQDA